MSCGSWFNLRWIYTFQRLILIAWIFLLPIPPVMWTVDAEWPGRLPAHSTPIIHQFARSLSLLMLAFFPSSYSLRLVSFIAYS